jgi:type VI secretion system protein VasG
VAIVDLKRLVGRLNGRSRRTLETAAALTLSRTHYNVEIGHWLVTLAADIDLDVTAVLQHYGVDRERLAADLSRTLGNWSTGNAGAPALAPEIVELIKQAWMVASIEQEATRIRSGHLLWGLIADERLAQRAREVSEQLLKIDQDALKRDFATITASSVEGQEAP